MKVFLLNRIWSPILCASVFVWSFFCTSNAALTSFIPGLFDKQVLHWARCVVRILGLNLKVKGLENLTAEKGTLFLFNHVSLLDIPILYTATNVPFLFGAKIELFKIPIFGFVLRKMGYLPISRHDREKSIQVYKEAQDRFAAGESFILAPEGTRQKQLKLGEFKSGPFVLAIEAKAPIQAIVLKGPEKIVPRHKLVPDLTWDRVIEIEILPIVETSTYTYETRHELKKRVRDSMFKSLEGMKKPEPKDSGLNNATL